MDSNQSEAKSSRDNLAIAAGQAEQLAGSLKSELAFQQNVLGRLQLKLAEEASGSPTGEAIATLVETATALTMNLESAAIGARAQARALARLEKEWL